MRTEKLQLVKDISEMMNNTDYLYFISYKGLKVKDFSEFRSELSKHDAKCHVLKNRLIYKAAEVAGPKEMLDLPLIGDTAMVFGKGDAGSVAKIIDGFSKSNQALAPKGGLLEGEILEDKDIKAIASLPSKEALQAQLLGVLEAPKRNLVTVLNAKTSSIVNVLNAFKNKIDENE